MSVLKNVGPMRRPSVWFCSTEPETLGTLEELLMDEQHHVVYVEVDAPGELMGRLWRLLSARAGDSERHNLHGHMVFRGDNVVFISAASPRIPGGPKVDLQNVTDIVSYRPAFMDDERFRCEKCGLVFEKEHSMRCGFSGDVHWGRCPDCFAYGKLTWVSR